MVRILGVPGYQNPRQSWSDCRGRPSVMTGIRRGVTLAPFWFWNGIFGSTGHFYLKLHSPYTHLMLYFREIITLWQIPVPIFHPTFPTPPKRYSLGFNQSCTICVLWKLPNKRCVWLLASASFFRLLKCVLDMTIWGIFLSSRSHIKITVAELVDCFSHIMVSPILNLNLF